MSAEPTGRRRQLDGFTLIEIVVSLAIITILGTLFAVKFVGDSTEATLRAPADALKRFARIANRQSAAFRDEYRITFFEKGFTLSQGGLTNASGAIESYQLENGAEVSLEIRRAGSSRWTRPGGDEWLFQPSGLCEPIEVRFSKSPGFIELKFHPMTAAVDRELSRFP